MKDQDGRSEVPDPKSQNETDVRSNLSVTGHAHSPVATIGIDSSGVITWLNDAAVTDLGLERAAAVGVSFFDLFKGETSTQTIEKNLSAGPPLKDSELTFISAGELRWALASSGPAYDKSGTATYLFIRDITRYKKRQNLFTYLNQAATSLAKTRDTATALQQIAGFIVPSFANWFTVDLVKDNSIELILLMHEDPAKIAWAYEYRKNYPPDPKANSGAGVVLKTGKPAFVPMVTEQMIDLTVTDPIQREEVKKIGLHSVILAPIWKDEQIVGLVNFISSRPDRHFDEEDLDFALNFANLIGLALENTRLNDEAANEIALRKQSEDRFRFLLDAIPHKMWTSGPDGRATYYNKQWYDYTGIQGFENLREKIWGHIHPDDLLDAAERYPAAVASGADVEMEHRLQQYDGSYRWHLSRLTAFKDNAGRPELWVGASTDIHNQKVYEMDLAAANEEITATNEELAAANEELESANEEQAATNEELRQAQESLEQTINDLGTSKRRFQSLLDSIPQIAWASAAGGAEVQYYNQRWYEYTGLSFEETKQFGWQKVIHRDDLAGNMDRISAIVHSEKPGEFETREKRADGVYRWHLVRISPIFDNGGRIEQWVGTATDIDDLKKLQQQKDDFISIASHELKTPLTTLKTSVQLLYRMKDEPAVDKFPKLIEQANRSMHKMSSLVDSLLNVNRAKETQVPLQKRWFILSELVNAACNPISVTGRQDILITGDKTLRVHADEQAIDQVVVNLVSNAVKYAAQSKEIYILLEDAGNKVKLSVKDNGPGIPAEQLPLLFNRYYQAGKRDYRNPGMGLGLYISSEIIKKHGGEMGVESEPGKGSTFWFTLPLGE